MGAQSLSHWTTRVNITSCVHAQLLSVVQLFATPWTAAQQAPLSMGFSRQENWRGCHAFLQGIFLIQGLNPSLLCLLHRQVGFLPLAPSGKPHITSSVKFSRSVLSNSLQPHGLQDTRLPCPSPTPRACSNSCPLSQRCRPTISSSVIPISSCLQSFPASGYFTASQLFASGRQSTGASVSTSVLPMNIQD